MSTFFTSDQHFGHRNIMIYDQRPFESIEQMDKELIRQWNSVVTNKDTVWFLGDWYLGGDFDYLNNIIQKLNGMKYMIYGNHDRLKIKDYYDMGFKFVSKYPVMLKHHFILSHAPIDDFEHDDRYYYIYGHIHNVEEYLDKTENSTCVCCCRWDYKPIRIEEFDRWLDE